MGTCASIQYSTDPKPLLIANGNAASTTVKVIHAIDGRIQEFRQPITAGNVLSGNQPDAVFICSAETMFVNCHVPHVPADEELRPDQIYFIMPISKSYRAISLAEICVLAIKASLAINKSAEGNKKKKKMSGTASFSGRRNKSNNKVDFQVALKMLG